MTLVQNMQSRSIYVYKGLVEAGTDTFCSLLLPNIRMSKDTIPIYSSYPPILASQKIFSQTSEFQKILRNYSYSIVLKLKM